MSFFELFLALRYVKPKKNFVSVLTMLSVGGPVLGVAVLIVVIAVMSGFDYDIKERILNMQSHLTLTKYSRKISNPDALIRRINKIDGLSSTGVANGAVLLQTDQEVTPQMLVGIIPNHEKRVTKLYKHIQEGKYQLNDNEALIGNAMARSQGLRIGSKILLHSLQKLGKNLNFSSEDGMKVVDNPTFDVPKELTVVGIFSLGMYEYDSGFIFTNLDTADEILGYDWGTADSIKIKTEDPFALEKMKKVLKKKFPYMHCTTWMEENRTLFGALNMEKRMMFFLLFFIVLVAAFGIGGTLLTFAMKKNREIGVMKSLGATPQQVLRIFLFLGLMIGGVATTIGTILGVVIVHYRTQVAAFISSMSGQNVFPEELYHLNQIPGRIVPSDLAVIYLGSLLLCVVAAMIPALFAAWSNPAQALKSEEML
jgi:lipoprotein-releasing system permease protein